MSLNLYIEGDRTIEVNGKTHNESQLFDFLWQTPTELTREVMKTNDFKQQLKTYFEWVKTVSEKDGLRIHKKHVKDDIKYKELMGWKLRMCQL